MAGAINKSGIKITLLTISLGQMGSLAISSVISNILEAMPTVSTQTAQFLMTFPGLFILFTSFLSAYLTSFFSYRAVVIAGLILNIAAAFGGFLFHGNIVFLFCWAAAFGAGVGLWLPLISATASGYFEDAERASLLGRISGAQNIGAITMTVIGGALALLSWYYVYLVYFIAVPGLVCALLYFPKNTESAQKPRRAKAAGAKRFSLKEVGIDGSVLLFGGMQLLFSIPYNAGPANFSLIVSENGLGNSSTAGILSGLFLFGGIISGWLFGALEKRMRTLTIPLGFFLLALGFVGLALTKNLIAIMLFTVIGGTGISLTLPQANLGVVKNKRPEQYALATATLMALGNLGAFLSPLTTSLAAVFTGSGTMSARMLFCAAFAFVFGIIFTIIFKLRKEE